MKAPTRKTTDVSPVEMPPCVAQDSIGKDEMNLAEFPISLLGVRPPEDVKTLVFSHGNGRLIITGSDAFGLPTALDDDVILALIQVTRQKNHFTEPTVPFTRYELLRLLRWPNEGKSYHRLDESLKRWSGVLLVYEKCWWDNRIKQNVDATLHIIDNVVIRDGGNRAHSQRPLSLSTFTWNSRFMESFQADNLKNLNLDLYFSLKLAPAKRLYRFLDKRFYRRSELIFPLDELAFTRVGFSQSYGGNVAKIKEKLHPAITELEAVGFLEPMTWKARYFKDAAGWKVRVFKGKGPLSLPVSPEPMLLVEPPPPPPAAELVARGVTAKTAVDLAANHPAETIAAKIEAFDWLRGKKDHRTAKNPPGYLVKSIQDDYAPPEGFVPRSERDRKAEAARLREEAEADARRRDAEEKDRDAARRAAADAYLNGLGAAERAALEARAIDEAGPEWRADYAAAHDQARPLMLRILLRERLQAGHLAAAGASGSRGKTVSGRRREKAADVDVDEPVRGSKGPSTRRSSNS